MGYSLGIDLGTTFSAAAIHSQGRTQVVTLGHRDTVVPSVAFVAEDGTTVLGTAGLRRGAAEPERLARQFKRRVGDSVPLILGGMPLTAELLTARLLAWLVSEVTAQQGEDPAAIAVTHPANWGAFKRERLDDIIRQAELDDVITLTEPEAAAISYAAAERVLVGDVVAVYDLGGGTFDASVLRKTAAGFEVLGTPSGVEHLGGIDVDEAVFAHVVQTIGLDLTELEEDEAARRSLARLRADCVEAKEALSSDTQTTISVTLPGQHHEVRITRAELESMVRPLLEQSVTALRRTISSAGLTPADVDRVLLVGGGSRMPLVAEMVGQALERPVFVDAHPKHATAMGAALAAQAHLDARGAGPDTGTGGGAAAGAPTGSAAPSGAGAVAVGAAAAGGAAVAAGAAGAVGASTAAGAPTGATVPATPTDPGAAPTAPLSAAPPEAPAAAGAASTALVPPAGPGGPVPPGPTAGVPTGPVTPPPGSPVPPPSPQGGGARRVPLLVGGALALVLAIAAVALARGDDGDDRPTTPASSEQAAERDAAGVTGSAAGEDEEDAGGSDAESTTTTASTTTTTAPTTTTRPTPEPLPVMSATASTVADDGFDACQNPTTFGAEQAIDGQPATAWRAPGDATGATLRFELGGPHRVLEVGLLPGYDKVDPCDGTDRWVQNRRPIRVTWTFDGGQTVEQTLSDARELQMIPVDVTTSAVQLRIRGVTDYVDRDFTAISEVAIWGA